MEKWKVIIFFVGLLLMIVMAVFPTRQTEDSSYKFSFLTKNITLSEKVKEITKCLNRELLPKVQQRGEYWVLYNYVKAEKSFECHESVTYTTHADYSFLDNLIHLVQRWQGPISLALHAPGTDFEPTLRSIYYLRNCIETTLVKDFVTFHIYFHNQHIPEIKNFKNFTSDCTAAPYTNVSELYKIKNDLLYPVNVGRNIAREESQTHFILPSDVELYPSKNLIRNFLEMIAKDERISENPKVYPLHLFEVQADESVPDNKTDLLRKIERKVAVPFHKYVCPECHSIPMYGEWLKSPEEDAMKVFTVGKRRGKFRHWEPIYIGTHAELLYDERLSWEGKSDKMTQGYVLCVRDYDFLILNNAFLVHRPGIKHYTADSRREAIVSRQSSLIKNKIGKELKMLFGENKECAL